MVTISLENVKWRGKEIVFTIPLPKRGPVFMSMSMTEYNQENFGLVIVDAEKFLHLWRSDPYEAHQEVANGSPETWPKDYKYKWAVDGFSRGHENPVPLADINYGVETKTLVTYKFLRFGRQEHQQNTPYISFTNGITRTIWLLSQGCEAFPVKCDLSKVHNLFLEAGAKKTRVYSVAELLKNYENQEK